MRKVFIIRSVALGLNSDYQRATISIYAKM